MGLVWQFNATDKVYHVKSSPFFLSMMVCEIINTNKSINISNQPFAASWKINLKVTIRIKN